MAFNFSEYIKEQTKDGLSIVNFVLTLLGVVAFVVLLIYAAIVDLYLAGKILFVCAVSFLAVSLLRKLLNVPRPDGYLKKAGESFPSRHTFSMMIIGLAWINLNALIGFVICGLAMVLGGVRIALGAHRPIDIYGAILLALACAWLGFVVL